MIVDNTLSQPEQPNDWRRTAIFQTCIKIENKSCKVIVDNDSCINVVASKLITTLGMKPVKHPNPYKVTWIDTTSIDVQKRCQIPTQFATYTDNVWCDMPPMNVGHIILGQPWLFNLDVTIYGRTNQCLFVHNGIKSATDAKVWWEIHNISIWIDLLEDSEWSCASRV